MPEIAFLLGEVTQAHNDNHRRLPAAFQAAGWAVTTFPHDAVRMIRGQVRLGTQDPQRFHLIWLLGFGPLSSFLDRMQLLRQLDQTRFVTAVDPLIHLHAKTAWTAHQPETYVSNDLGYLTSILNAGGEWVAKPTAGSFGRGVARVGPDAEGRAVLERLIGKADGSGRYCLLQRFVPEVMQGEKRTLVAGGRLVASYLRRPGPDFRTNMAAGGQAETTDLSPPERQLVQQLADQLEAAGVGFAAVDTVFPYLIEVNVANPGGLGTMTSLYDQDLAADVVEAVIAARPAPSSMGPARR